MTRDKLRKAKKTQACMRCGKYFQWYRDQREDGFLEADILSSDEPIEGRDNEVSLEKQVNRAPLGKQSVVKQYNQKEVSLNFALLKNLKDIPAPPASVVQRIGPIVYNGAPY